MIRPPSRSSSTRSSSFARSSIAWALCLCLAFSTSSAKSDDDLPPVDVVDDAAGFVSANDLAAVSLMLAGMKAAGATSGNITNDVAAILDLLSTHQVSSSSAFKTYPVSTQGYNLSRYLWSALFDATGNDGSPSKSNSYLKKIYDVSWQSATNGWRRDDIAAQSAQLSAILGLVQSNNWSRSDVVAVVQGVGVLTNAVNPVSFGTLMSMLGSAANSAYDSNVNLLNFYDSFYGTLDGNYQMVEVMSGLDPVVEVIEESTATYINSLDRLVRDFVIGGVDYTASNTADIVQYVENINDILTENFDTQLSVYLDGVSNVVDLLRMIHEDDLGYDTTSRSVQSDLLALLQSLGYGSSTGSATTLASDMGILQHDLFRAANAAESNLLQNYSQSLGSLEIDAQAAYTGDDSYNATNAPLPEYEDLVSEADTAAASTAMSAGSQSFEHTAQQLRGMIGTGGDDEIVVIPEMTVGGIHVAEYRARLGTSITPVCRRIMQFVWAVSLFAALFGLASSEWAFYANLGRNWTMSGGFHEKGSP